MSRGDSIPRYTYMMDFNPMDEETPLRDYWQATDELDAEDAATIASLATQALQSKSSYEHGDGIEVNEPAVVANYMYSESRSSPQSQYSTAMATEPAESFRGLMEDHDRGAQMSEENAMSDYDFEPETRGHVSSDAAGVEEPSVLSREEHAPDPLRPMLSVAAEVETADQNSLSSEVEMSAAITASRVVNGVLSRSYAATPNEVDVNLQALQSQAPQLTPPQSESPSISVERPDDAELEKELTINTDERHDDGEPENGLTIEEEGEEGRKEEEEQEEQEREEEDEEDEEKQEKQEREEENEEEQEEQEKQEEEEKQEEQEREEEDEAKSDSGVQLQLLMESNERSTIDGEGSPLLQQTPRKRGRPRKSDAVVAVSASVTKRPGTAQVAVREKASLAGSEVVESAATDGADPSRAEEMPTERKRGRPRKSEIPEPASAPTPAKRGPGRPPKSTTVESTTVESTLEAMPTTGKRGRPRKSSMADATRASVETPTTTPVSGKRGRPRKSDVVGITQASTNETQLPAVGAAVNREPSLSKRGRPRKSDMIDTAQTSSHEAQLSAVVATTPMSSKRGRPRKSDVMSTAQAPTHEDQLPAIEAAVTETPASRKRGRPRKSDVMDAAQASPNEAQLPAVEALITTTPASSKRGRPPKESVTTSTTTPGKRGRPRKSDVPLLQTEIEIPLIGDTNKTVDSPATKSVGRRGRPPRQADPLEDQERAASPSPLSTKKRGRGRPPKSAALLPADLPSTGAEPGPAMDAQEAAPQEPESKFTEDATEDLAVDETASKPTQEGVGGTPARKRGRPKAVVVDEPLPVMDILVTTPGKKRGRPLKAIAAIDSAEKHERPLQSEAQEEEEPVIKRRRTSNDATMEDAVDEGESQGGTREDGVPSVQERKDAIAANDAPHKQSALTMAKPRSVRFTEEEKDAASGDAKPSSRLDRRPRISGGGMGARMLEESARTKQVERPRIVPPKSLLEILSDEKKMVRPKTYGKRSKR